MMSDSVQDDDVIRVAIGLYAAYRAVNAIIHAQSYLHNTKALLQIFAKQDTH